MFRRMGVWVGVLALSCAGAWANTVTCAVTLGGNPVVGADVTLQPLGVSARTDVNGRCVFTDVRAGRCELVATYKTRTDELYARVVRISVRHGQDLSVNVQLRRAIWINEYMPLNVGREWVYVETATRGGRRSVRERIEKVERAVGSGDAVLVVVRWRGVPEYMQSHQSSNEQGWKTYLQRRTDGIVVRYDPPLFVENPVVQGERIYIRSTARLSDGTTQTVSMGFTLEGFEDVTVPLGRRREAAKFDGWIRFGSERRRITMWLGKYIGVIKSVERQRGEEVFRKELKHYTVPLRPLGPQIQPRPQIPPRPVPPPRP